MQRRARAGFTLIELLIVIAVVAILSVVVVLVLNPTELLRQARDSNRLSDLDTLNRGVLLYVGDNGGSLGTASTTYLSLVDPTATTTAGTDCVGLGFPTSSNWNFHCAASSTLRKVDGTGWIPINFTSLTFRPPFGSLPVDPTNTSSTGFYYTYVPLGSTYQLTVILNSQKYIASQGKVMVSGSNLGTEILTNGNMESASGGLASSWSNVVGGGGSIDAADAESGNVIGGSRTQKLTINTGAGGSGLRQNITVVCNSWYRARMIYRSTITGGTPTFIGVYDISGGGQGSLFTLNLTSDNTTRVAEMSFQAPSNCAGSAYVDAPRTNAGYSGTIYVDEVSVRKLL